MPMRNIKLPLLGTFWIMLAFCPVLAAFTRVSAAASYPSQPLRLIVPEAAGGGTDTVSRLIAAKLSERLNKQVIVENRGGAGGVIATEMVAKADPDGHTLVMAAGRHTIQPALEKLPYDPVKSFTPIGRLGSGVYALSINPRIPAHSVKELIALAKQKPGYLIFGTSGVAATAHVSSEFFRIMADIDFKIVHFKGAGPAMVDVLGGHSHALISSLPGQLPHIKSGKLRVLGTGGLKRSVILPDVPTIAESGLPGFRASSWYGILAPAGTQATVVDRLNKELKVILESDETKKQFLNSGVEVDYLSPTEFGAFLEEDLIRWASVVKKANIKLEK